MKAVFLTEYGGRLWELWDKKTGKNLLYTNDVLRFSNLAIRNAWFSGGVEWNLGIIGHNPLTTEPLYVAKTQTDEGDPVLRMYEYERIRGVIWQMDFWLEEACPYLNCRMRIVNDSNQVIPMYWWSNMAVPEYEGGRLVVPAKEAFTAVGTNGFKVEIPFVNGIDVTDYKKIPSSIFRKKNPNILPILRQMDMDFCNFQHQDYREGSYFHGEILMLPIVGRSS